MCVCVCIYVLYVCGYIYVYIYIFFLEHMLGFSIPRALSSWNMHHSAHFSVQWACCLDIDFCHMFSAPDCAAFDGGMFCVAEKGNDTVTVAN